MSFDQGDFGTKTCCAGGRNQTGGATSDDGKIVARCRLGVGPSRRMNMGLKPSIVIIPWEQRSVCDHEVGAGAGEMRLPRARRAIRVMTIVTAIVAVRPSA